jgi:hypothetical protein
VVVIIQQRLLDNLVFPVLLPLPIVVVIITPYARPRNPEVSGAVGGGKAF